MIQTVTHSIVILNRTAVRKTMIESIGPVHSQPTATGQQHFFNVTTSSGAVFGIGYDTAELCETARTDLVQDIFPVDLSGVKIL